MQRKSLELLDQVLKVINSYDFALTLRQIYYQLVAKQIIPNEQKYYGKLSYLCVIGRDEGMLPEEAFADRLRQLDKPSSWVDLSHFMDTVRQAYRKDIWRDQPKYVEIWTEKDALRGVIDDITHNYNVGLLVVRGQVSRTAIYESYQRFAQEIKKGKLSHLYYFGDFDPSGLTIYNSLVERLRGFGPSGRDIYFKRVALTPNQIEEYNLPQDPAKQTDPSYRKFVDEYGDNVVELDSLPPDVLKKYIKSCIEMNIDHIKLEEAQVTERKEQTMIEEFIDNLSI